MELSSLTYLPSTHHRILVNVLKTHVSRALLLRLINIVANSCDYSQFTSLPSYLLHIYDTLHLCCLFLDSILCLLCLSFLIVWRNFLLPSFVFCQCLVPVLRAESMLLRELDDARYKSHVYYCYYSDREKTLC